MAIRGKRQMAVRQRSGGQRPASGLVRKRVGRPSRRSAPAPRRCNDACTCPCECGKKTVVSLFEDGEFPARWDSLSGPCDAADWKRPHEICEEPKLFLESSSRFDVDQGALGTCYFLAACAAVADRRELLKKVIPEKQVLYGPGYDGSVTFRFWNMGEWEDVRIDDRLPVDSDGDLAYAHCPSPSEFWLPLLEKAFARFHGRYGDVDGGFITSGLMALTGFTVESLSLRNWTSRDDFRAMKHAMDSGAVIVCAADNPGPGIPDGHAYTVTKLFDLKRDQKNASELCMVRVRNPWGDATEWTGAWRDGDGHWKKLSNEVKERMEYRVKKDGEFWMEMKDFVKAFPDVVIFREKPRGLEDAKIVAQINGRWTAEEGVGGPPKDVDCFAKNPQFLLKIDAESNTIGVNEEEEEKEKEDESIYVELIHNISSAASFYIFQVEGPVHTKLSGKDLLTSKPISTATSSECQCGAGTDVSLTLGKLYVVVPCTDTAGYPGDFLLRVFGRQQASLKEIYEHTCCSCPCASNSIDDECNDI